MTLMIQRLGADVRLRLVMLTSWKRTRMQKFTATLHRGRA